MTDGERQITHYEGDACPGGHLGMEAPAQPAPGAVERMVIDTFGDRAKWMPNSRTFKLYEAARAHDAKDAERERALTMAEDLYRGAAADIITSNDEIAALWQSHAAVLARFQALASAWHLVRHMTGADDNALFTACGDEACKQNRAALADAAKVTL